MFPGAAANEIYNEFINTSESGIGLLQNSSSLYAIVPVVFEGGGLNPVSTISQTVFESSG